MIREVLDVDLRIQADGVCCREEVSCHSGLLSHVQIKRYEDVCHQVGDVGDLNEGCVRDPVETVRGVLEERICRHARKEELEALDQLDVCRRQCRHREGDVWLESSRLSIYVPSHPRRRGGWRSRSCSKLIMLLRLSSREKLVGIKLYPPS